MQANRCSTSRQIYWEDHLGIQILIFAHNLLEHLRVWLDVLNYPLQLGSPLYGIKLVEVIAEPAQDPMGLGCVEIEIY